MAIGQISARLSTHESHAQNVFQDYCRRATCRQGIAAKLPGSEVLAAQGAAMAPAGAIVGQPAIGYGVHALSDPRLLALWKSGLAPEWLRRQIDDQIKEMTRYLSPDVMALRSVSVGALFRINHRRMTAMAINAIEERAGMDMARRAFFMQDVTSDPNMRRP